MNAWLRDGSGFERISRGSRWPWWKGSLLVDRPVSMLAVRRAVPRVPDLSTVYLAQARITELKDVDPNGDARILRGSKHVIMGRFLPSLLYDGTPLLRVDRARLVEEPDLPRPSNRPRRVSPGDISALVKIGAPKPPNDPKDPYSAVPEAEALAAVAGADGLRLVLDGGPDVAGRLHGAARTDDGVYLLLDDAWDQSMATPDGSRAIVRLDDLVVAVPLCVAPRPRPEEQQRLDQGRRAGW